MKIQVYFLIDRVFQKILNYYFDSFCLNIYVHILVVFSGVEFLNLFVLRSNLCLSGIYQHKIGVLNCVLEYARQRTLVRKFSKSYWLHMISSRDFFFEKLISVNHRPFTEMTANEADFASLGNSTRISSLWSQLISRIS